MSESILREASKEFAKDIVLLCRRLNREGVESVLLNPGSNPAPGMTRS